jgi:uncharacterized protein YbbC (DUF1343 family)
MKGKDDMQSVKTGLEVLIQQSHPWITGARLGLLCNPASVDRDYGHARDRLIQRFPEQLKALYSPQHGFHAEKQDNMIESDHMIDAATGLPVYSLYGETRIPTPQMMAPIDVLLVDLQDVGTRVYTFIYTLSYCLEAAAASGIRVIVLDRPNPINGRDLEGNVLQTEWASFVGRFPIPMRHAMTIGEIARLFNDHFGCGAALKVISMQGWQRSMWFNDTGLPWVAPSPNMPTVATAVVYPGQVIWEGTNISEGRGTALPFEILGAPFLKPEKILEFIGGPRLPGAFLRPCVFAPTSGKHAGKDCRGFQIHVVDADRYRPYRTSLILLQAILHHHKGAFQWKSDPYEYEFDKRAIDLILGSREVRQRVSNMESIQSLETSWQRELEAFRSLRRAYLLYPE